MQLFPMNFYAADQEGAGMSVLVTGGAGYIGGHMALGLLDAGERVVVLDNLSTGFAWAVPEEPEMMAPAWPILRPGGAVTPAM